MQPSSDRGQVESQLLAFVKQLERNYYDWRAVHLHLSQLRAQNRRDYQLRVAASEFDGLLRRFSSELFQLSNGDIVFLWHGGSVAPTSIRWSCGCAICSATIRSPTRPRASRPSISRA